MKNILPKSKTVRLGDGTKRARGGNRAPCLVIAMNFPPSAIPGWVMCICADKPDRAGGAGRCFAVTAAEGGCGEKVLGWSSLEAAFSSGEASGAANPSPAICF